MGFVNEFGGARAMPDRLIHCVEKMANNNNAYRHARSNTVLIS
jgi:hypothetical protein